MQRDELHIVSVGVSELCQNFSKRSEWNIIIVGVSLIYFVSNNNNLVFIANFDDIFDILALQNLSSRVSRVDTNHSSELNAKVFSIFDFGLDFIWINAPLLCLIQIVLHHCSSIKGQ